MSEEAVAETSSETSQTSDQVSTQESGNSGFNMDSAVKSLASDLFGKKESSEPEEKQETKPKETPETSEASEAEEQDAEETPEETPKEAAKTERPASWKKDMQATWDGMTKEAQDYVIHREEQMKQGLTKDRDDAVLGRTMRDTIAPYSSLLKAQGISEKNAVANMMNFHYTLSTAPIEQRKEAFAKLANSYGIKFDGQGQSQEIDPTVKNLTNELNSIKSFLNKSQEQAQQAVKAKVANEVDSFAAEHPYFDDLADEIATFLQDKNVTLEKAYEMAVWVNPLTRQKEMDRLQQEKDQKLEAESERKKAEVQKAKAVNVKTKDTGKVPTAPKGSMFDTLNETYREIKQRNRS